MIGVDLEELRADVDRSAQSCAWPAANVAEIAQDEVDYRRDECPADAAAA